MSIRTDKIIPWLLEDKQRKLLDSYKIDELYQEATKDLLPTYKKYITEILIEDLNIDPLTYVSKIHSGMYLNMKTQKVMVIPEGIKYIEMHAFDNCSELEEVIFPSSLLLIEYGAFRRCTNLSKISIKDDLLEIEEEAFRGTSLKEVEIPENCRLGYNVFPDNCEVIRI